VQWVNYGNNLDPRRATGGFFISQNNLALLDNPEIEGAVPSTQHFKGGDSETGVFIESLWLAVFETRFGWLVREGNRRRIEPVRKGNARSKHHALCFLRTVDGHAGPVIVTHTGVVTGEVQDAIKEHRDVVRQATNGKGAGAWFWMRLSAGEVAQAGKGSKTSPYTQALYVESDFDPEELYVGDELADWMEDNFERNQEWAAEWGTEQADDHEPSDDVPEGRPAPAQRSEPAQQQSAPTGHGQGSYNPLGEARKAWSSNWNRLKQIGVVAPFLDNSWNAAQVTQAANYMEDTYAEVQQGGDKDAALSALITRLDTI
jgi:hypothetical protein